jgi:hypothetical protein
MFPYRLKTTLPFLSAALALAATGVAFGQPPRIPPDARGYQTTQIMKQYYQNRAARLPDPAPPRVAPSRSQEPAYTASVVSVNVPNNPVPPGEPTTYVNIKGEDGVVRRFPLAKGVKVEYTPGPIVLRPGESTTIRITPIP